MNSIEILKKADGTATITTLEVAEMMEVEHKEILKKLEGTKKPDGSIKQIGIIPTLTEGNFPLSDYFILSSYKDASGKENKCYQVTKLGCDFLANKFTGEKGILFTARYVKRFNEMEQNQICEKYESISEINETVKILTPFLEKAGLDSKIQLLTVKTIYEKAGLELPIILKADNQYFDTTYIARKVGVYYRNSGKPADKVVNEIIRRLDIPEEMYMDTWESKGKWQGTVRKYSEEIIKMINEWCRINGHPINIQYIQSDGKKKSYHVIWKEVA